MKEIAVIQFPGTNCEYETARAVSAAGMVARVFRWNSDARELRGFDGFVVPGGFSYQDRIRAGAVAAKKKLMKTLLEESLAGKPLLGICNGAQILIESGILPGIEPGRVEMALAPNAGRRGYYCDWIYVKVACVPSRCAFTGGYREGEVFPLPVAHAEGRFVASDEKLADRLEENDQVIFRYSSSSGTASECFPVNPNGSIYNIAGLCNPKGNVLGLMPHPERAVFTRQVPEDVAGRYGALKRGAAGDFEKMKVPGPGSEIFRSMLKFLEGNRERI